jgi:hypothetical protein
MQSEHQPAVPPQLDERAAEEARLTIERAEEAWRRQIQGENAASSASGSTVLRVVLLGVAIAAIVFLLFQRIAQLG